MVPTACNEDLDFEEIEEEIEEYDIDLAVKLSLDKLSYTVTAIGNIEEKRGRNKSIITEHGFYYGYAQVYDESNYERDYTKIKSNEPVNEFSFEIPADMEKQSSVFCCVVYAKTEKGIFFSAIRSVFLWSDAEVEVEISSNFTDLTFERATVYASCSVIDEARFPITERGFCYINTHLIKGENPTISDDYIVVEGTGSGKFSATIKGLKPAAAYKVRAYARNIAGITYSRSYVTLPMYSSESFIPEVIAKSDRKNMIPLSCFAKKKACNLTR